MYDIYPPSAPSSPPLLTTAMEPPQSSRKDSEAGEENLNPTVDTSRPFSSVKEAVAVFGERLLAGDLYSSPKPLLSSIATPKREIPPNFSEIQPVMADEISRNLSEVRGRNRGGKGQLAMEDALRKIEAELEETKAELRVLKERESETEVILASLNAELHKSMSRMAKAEAAEAAKAVAEREIGGGGGGSGGGGVREVTPTLAQILSFREEGEGLFLEKERMEKMMAMKKKKKPIVPILGDLFSRKKKGSSAIRSSLYSSTHVYLN